MYDLIIIGAGPGGYTAAEKAGEKGMSVLLIEKALLGGVCLNEGCIPTKILLHASKLYSQNKQTSQFGVNFNAASIDLNRTKLWINEVIENLKKGIEYRLKKCKVELICGQADFVGHNKIHINDKIVEGKNIIIATGAVPELPEISGVQKPIVKTSRDLINILKIPKKLTIVGGGIVGLEFASIFSNLGSEVTIIEKENEILPFFDRDISSMMRRILKHIHFYLNSEIISIDECSIKFKHKGEAKINPSDMILVAIGRKPKITDLGLEKIGLSFNEKGINIDDNMKTNIPGIYAIGDVTGKSMLAHSASRMACVAVNTISNIHDSMNFRNIPTVAYTIPEAASCGFSEEEAKKNNLSIKTVKIPFSANGRFLAEHGNARGICKVIVDAENNKLIGIHLLGANCSELIFGAAILLESKLSPFDIQKIIFPHPTVSEIIKDTIEKLK